MDVPIVTLTSNKTEIAVGEEVTFTTKSRILSNRPDFDAQKVIRYDFDGNGVWDKVTKESTVTHIYTKPYEAVKPRVEVTYRKNPVLFVGDTITVRQMLKPLLEAHVYDKTLYLRDYSLGDITKREICFNGPKSCKTITTGEQLSYTYDDYGSKTILFTIQDDYGNKLNQTLTTTLVPIENIKPIYLMSIPKARVNEEGKYYIPVANNQDNSVLLNIIYTGSGVCYIDTDITDDANYDNKPDNDQDVPCNTMRLVKYDSYADIINARIVYEGPDKKLVGNGIIVQFTDQEIILTQAQKLQYNRIQNLIATLPSSNEDQKYIKKTLSIMAENVRINKSQIEQIMNLRAFLENTKGGLTEDQVASITKLIDEFNTAETIAAAGGNVVDQARQALIDLVSHSEAMQAQVIAAFDVIKNLAEPAGQPEIVKSEMQKLLTFFQKNTVSLLESQDKGNEDKIIESDFETEVLPRICDVLGFYSIPSEKCPDGSGVTLESSTSTSTSVWSTVLKRTGIVVGILGGIFLLIVVFFAVKARIQQNNDDEGQV